MIVMTGLFSEALPLLCVCMCRRLPRITLPGLFLFTTCSHLIHHPCGLLHSSNLYLILWLTSFGFDVRDAVEHGWSFRYFDSARSFPPQYAYSCQPVPEFESFARTPGVVVLQGTPGLSYVLQWYYLLAPRR